MSLDRRVEAEDRLDPIQLRAVVFDRFPGTPAFLGDPDRSRSQGGRKKVCKTKLAVHEAFAFEALELIWHPLARPEIPLAILVSQGAPSIKSLVGAADNPLPVDALGSYLVQVLVGAEW